ncbi:MAG: endonuclease/exonuclease/phosphatase family protein [Clostridia bacterium]|nr:endonuclease/exonuclease/phosphatase family protein [Clostridia bacterium]
MKLLTLNTHSLIEENYNNKLHIFTDAIEEIKPDIIALQEVNQTAKAKAIPSSSLFGNVYEHTKVPIKEDNHAVAVNSILRLKGINYNWVWLPIKNGYKVYDEGIAIFSLSPIINIKAINLSKKDDYYNWRTRKAIGIKTENNEWFYSVHFGWWDDSEEPFKNQWTNFENAIKNDEKVWILGDFNATPKSPSYDLITKCSWYDSYTYSNEKDNGITVSGKIAGWSEDSTDKRIDYIFSNYNMSIKSSKVIFNGVNKEVISDHFGVIAEI